MCLSQDLLEAGALDVFNKILSNPARKGMKKEACWLVSNVAAGEPHQVQALINADVLPTIVWCCTPLPSQPRKSVAEFGTNIRGLSLHIFSFPDSGTRVSYPEM